MMVSGNDKTMKKKMLVNRSALFTLKKYTRISEPMTSNTEAIKQSVNSQGHKPASARPKPPAEEKASAGAEAVVRAKRMQRVRWMKTPSCSWRVLQKPGKVRP